MNKFVALTIITAFCTIASLQSQTCKYTKNTKRCANRATCKVEADLDQAALDAKKGVYQTASAAKHDARKAQAEIDDANCQACHEAQRGANKVVAKTKDVAHQVADKTKDIAHATKDTASRVAHNTQDAAVKVGHKIEETAQKAGNKIKEGALHVKNRVNEVTRS